MIHLSPNEKRYMPGLDGLRTLAVFAVILYHLNVGWAPGGLLGVSIFFVLSGYLITDLLTAEWRRSGTLDLKQFWIRRCRRLLPAMIVMLAAVTAWVTLARPSTMPVLKGDAISSLFYVNNWYLIYHQVSYFEKFGPVSPLGHLWSLSVEEQFYVLWPLLMLIGLKLAPRRGKMFLFMLSAAAVSALAMLVIYDPGTDPSRVYYGTDTRAFSLLIGAALSIIWPSRKLSSRIDRFSRRLLDGIGILSLAAILVMIWTTNEYDAFLYPGGLVLLLLAAAAAVAVLAHPASRVGRLIGCKPLRWLGVRSYGIYIWHYPVIILSTTNGAEDVSVLKAVFQVAASIALAALSYTLIEEPIRKGLLGKGWKKLRSGKLGVEQIPLKGWITGATLLLLVIISCTGIARTPAVASTVQALGPASGADGSSPVSQEVSAAGNGTGNADADASGQQTAKGGDRHDAGPAETSAGSPAEAQTPPSAQDQQAPPDDAASGTTGQAEDPPSAGGKATSSANPVGVTGTTPAKAGEPGGSSGKASGQGAGAAGTNAPPPVKQNLAVSAIGDSILLDAAPYLQQYLPGIVVDAEIGRQMSEAPDIVERLRAEGKLGDYVVLELGTNGAFSSKQLSRLLDSLKDVRQVVLVNTRVPRNWESTVNTALRKAADAHDNTTLLDWYEASSGQSFFTPDGVHLKADGAKLLASLITNTVGTKK